MGKAKIKQKQHEHNLDTVLKSAKRFNKIRSFEDFTFDTNINLHSIKACQHLMNLIFIRAKNIHRSLVEAIKKNNSYTSFILLKAYWENVAMLGYVFISARNLMKTKNYKKLLDLSIKNALGGRGFITDDLLEHSRASKEDLTQTNLITWMQKVDADFDKEVGKGKKFSEFEKVYNEFIAEGGHSTFLGLNICEEKKSNGSIRIDYKKTSQYNDDKMTYNHLALADNYFYYYWDKYNKETKIWLKEL